MLSDFMVKGVLSKYAAQYFQVGKFLSGVKTQKYYSRQQLGPARLAGCFPLYFNGVLTPLFPKKRKKIKICAARILLAPAPKM